MMEEYTIELLEQQRTRSKRKTSFISKQQKQTEDFRCRNCHAYVSSEPLFSGVRNRNHCPFCLWSRHLDLDLPGDRLAACKGMMQPIGLTVKRIWDKYGIEKVGELMLIHRCEDCARLSINRIAADDDPHRLIDIFYNMHPLSPEIESNLRISGIQPLHEDEFSLVQIRLFGREGSFSGCVV